MSLSHHLHAIHDERFSFDSLRPLLFSFLMHSDLHTDLDNLDSVENNLRHSAKGSNDGYDVTFSLTGYEPNDTVSNELIDSQGSFSYITQSSDQDMDDTTLGKLLTEAHREYADYCDPEGVFVSPSSMSVTSDRTGKPVGKSNIDQFCFGVRNAYSAHNQFLAITQAERMVDRTVKPVGESSSSAQIRTLFDEQRQMIIAECCEKVGQHELQAARAEQERRILQEELWSQQKDRQKLTEDQNTIMELSGRLQELQNEVNCMNDSRDFQDAESVRSGNSHVTSQPMSFPAHPIPEGMLRPSFVSPRRKEGPPSIWDTYGISGNVFSNPQASSTAPYPQELNPPWRKTIEEPLHTSTEEKSDRPERNQDLRCQSGPSAKDSVIFSGGDYSKNYGADQQRLQISDLHFDKFPTPATFACWKIRFKTEVCNCSQFLTEAMQWIKEVEMVDSEDESRSSSSTRGISMPNFEVLDARIASALNKIIHNSHFKRKISLEEQKAQKEDRFLRGRQIAYLIYDHFRVTGTHDSVENYTDLFTIVLRNDDIQEFDSKWDGILLSMTKIPHDDILEGLYKLRIRESEKLKTVLELYYRETHQKKLGPDYHRLKTMVKRSIEQEIRNKNFASRIGNFEKNAVVKNQGSYDPETVPDKVQTRIETRFRFRIQKPEFPVSGFRFPISGFSSCFIIFPHFSPFFPIFLIFQQLSTFFIIFHHFSLFFTIFPIFSRSSSKAAKTARQQRKQQKQQQRSNSSSTGTKAAAKHQKQQHKAQQRSEKNSRAAIAVAKAPGKQQKKEQKQQQRNKSSSTGAKEAAKQ